MIRTALTFIRKELDTFMVMREQDPGYTPDNVVDLQALMMPEGTINISDTSHVTIILAGVEEVRREGKHPYYIPAEDKSSFRLNPPVELDLFVLFVAHKRDYRTALRDLSDVLGFFQANPVFDRSKYPAMNEPVGNPEARPWQLIDRLSFSLNNLTFDQQNNLWGMFGSKYMPSVVYRMRMLTFFETKSNEKISATGELTIG